jgi:alkylated DNA nucleotide flippase Atl1
MNWWLVGGSLAAVLALAGIARLLGLGGAQRLVTGNDAIQLAEALVSGFEGKAGIVATNGELAAVAGGPSDLVVIEPLGARHRATRYKHARVVMSHPAADGCKVTVELQPGALFRITVADAEAARTFTDMLG